MKNRTLACLVAIIIAIAATSLLPTAPVNAGEIGGTVTDPSGGVVPGATVTLTGNGLTERTATDQAGSYRVQALSPGHYTVVVTAPGFTEFAEHEVVVARGQRSEADAPLAIREARQVITVTASRNLRPRLHH
jgi:hypothetical protein